jgi:hypothetical protein
MRSACAVRRTAMWENITCPICQETIGRGMKVVPMIIARTAGHVYSCPYCDVLLFPHKENSLSDEKGSAVEVRKV